MSIALAPETVNPTSTAQRREAEDASRGAAKDWTVRQATSADIPALNELYKSVYGHARDAGETLWRLFDNPVGPALILIAEMQDLIVGEVALWPVQLTIGLITILGAQSIDALTHPEYRRRGIYLDIAARLSALGASCGLQMLYGFPNDRSYGPSVNHLGWTHVCDVGMFSRPLHSDALSRIPAGLRSSFGRLLRVWPQATTKGVSFIPEAPSNQEIERILHGRPTGEAICQVGRSPEWYDWRFSRRAGAYEWQTAIVDGRPVGFVVIGRSDDGMEARLADLVGDTPAVRAALVSTAVDHARSNGFRSLVAVTNRPEALTALRRNGFRRNGHLPFKVRLTGSGSFAANYLGADNWQLFGADFDVF